MQALKIKKQIDSEILYLSEFKNMIEKKALLTVKDLLTDTAFCIILPDFSFFFCKILTEKFFQCIFVRVLSARIYKICL